MIKIKDTLTDVSLYSNPLKCMGVLESNNEIIVLFREIEKFYICDESNDLIMI